MIASDTFTRFARRMAATQGCPYMVIAETPNPIRDLGPEALRTRVEAMLPAIIDGLTLPPVEIERRLKDIARQQIHPEGVVRSAVPV
ncbi:MAG: hypothetical protein A3G24_11090 [Betaproteobacteria bacterium RIFCSPLOWO2_12_FULL_62_13]|nr:MAG: hypothetical protein A3G24_11090 [Betaproteobacteria bacterium RIFCSPLOWO2_12_FULL_62_13]